MLGKQDISVVGTLDPNPNLVNNKHVHINQKS